MTPVLRMRMASETYRVTERDRAIVTRLAEQLGVSRGDVVRLALRSLDERLRDRSQQGELEGVLTDSARSLERPVAA